MSDVTQILSRIEDGDPQAAEQLLPLVYEELRRLAAAKLANEKAGQTLQATALVHEAYLRLLGDQKGHAWDNRGHFFGAAAEAMRRILVENYRRKRQLKRGGEFVRVALDGIEPPCLEKSTDLIALDESLSQLEAQDPEAANVVKLRYFAGLNMPEIAEALGISLRAAERNWTYARTWLHGRLSEF